MVHFKKMILYYIDNSLNKRLGEYFGKLIYHYPKEFYQDPPKGN